MLLVSTWSNLGLNLRLSCAAVTTLSGKIDPALTGIVTYSPGEPEVSGIITDSVLPKANPEKSRRLKKFHKITFMNFFFVIFVSSPVFVGARRAVPLQLFLLHQNHLFNFREVISFYTIEIDSAGNRIALIILSVPGHLMYSGFFYLIYQGRNLLS